MGRLMLHYHYHYILLLLVSEQPEIIVHLKEVEFFRATPPLHRPPRGRRYKNTATAVNRIQKAAEINYVPS